MRARGFAHLLDLFRPRIAMLGVVLAAGCGTGTLARLEPSAPLAVRGSVHGGQQPVSGASIQLYAAGASGYASAAMPLLSTPAKTDAAGMFSITGMYTCPSATTPVYIVAQGGNPGLASGTGNSALAMMTALGPCGNLSASTSVAINELTTVASVWPLAQFMSDAAHVGSSPGNAQGLANAFAMVNNLVDTAAGAAPGSAPPGSLLPVAELNTLADALAACINSPGGAGGDGSLCGTLFSAATAPGGLAPTDTIAAAVNLARNPGLNVAPVFGLISSTAPFQPVLTSAPADWTVTLQTPLSGDQFSSMAFDRDGNLWYVDGSNISEIGPTGATLLKYVLKSQTVAQPYTLLSARGLTIDPSGNLWATGETDTQIGTGDSYNRAQTLFRIPPATSPVTTYPLPVDTTSFVANADGSGNIFLRCTTLTSCNFIEKLGPDGTVLGTMNLATGLAPISLLPDSGGNVWFGATAGTITVGSGRLSASTTYACNCLFPFFMATDGKGKLWTVGSAANTGAPVTQILDMATGSAASVATPGVGLPVVDGDRHIWMSYLDANSKLQWGKYAGDGTLLTSVAPISGSAASTTAPSMAIDGAGNLWYTVQVSQSPAQNRLAIVVGAAAPTITPLSLALKGAAEGTRP